MSEVKFEGQVALVTGASRGIGAAIALELAQKGLKVIGTATSDEGATKIRDRKSTRLNSSHLRLSRMPSSA